jgi:hypothetical protein
VHKFSLSSISFHVSFLKPFVIFFPKYQCALYSGVAVHIGRLQQNGVSLLSAVVDLATSHRVHEAKIDTGILISATCGGLILTLNRWSVSHALILLLLLLLLFSCCKILLSLVLVVIVNSGPEAQQLVVDEELGALTRHANQTSQPLNPALVSAVCDMLFALLSSMQSVSRQRFASNCFP